MFFITQIANTFNDVFAIWFCTHFSGWLLVRDKKTGIAPKGLINETKET